MGGGAGLHSLCFGPRFAHPAHVRTPCTLWLLSCCGFWYDIFMLWISFLAPGFLCGYPACCWTASSDNRSEHEPCPKSFRILAVEVSVHNLFTSSYLLLALSLWLSFCRHSA